MPDVHRLAEVQVLREFCDIARVGVHVVAGRRLRGASVPAAVVRDHTIAVSQEEQHLRIPVIS